MMHARNRQKLQEISRKQRIFVSNPRNYGQLFLRTPRSPDEKDKNRQKILQFTRKMTKLSLIWG